MQLKSKGLGRMTLPFAMNEAAIREADDGELWFHGKIKQRTVNWDYRMRLDDPDIVRFIAMAHNPRIVAFIARRAGLRLFARVVARLAKTLLVFLHLRSEQTPEAARKVLDKHLQLERAAREKRAKAQADKEKSDGVLVEGAGPA